MAPLLLLLFSLSLAFHPAVATLYIVGGKAGWTTPSRAKLDYAQWSSSIVFTVGDSLEFNYAPKAHNVLEVTRTDFRYCNTTNPLASFVDGKTVVVLEKPGSYYFIDGMGDHCKEGQKFQAKVTTMASSPSAFAPAPEPSSSHGIPPAVAAACDLQTSMATVVSLICAAAMVGKWL